MTDQRILLVRHAETEWSRSGRHTGRTDVPLTEAGRAAGARLRPLLADRSFGLVLTSPLQRARETCALAGLGDRAEERDDLVEWDYGEHEGRTPADILADDPGWLLWRDGAPGGEAVAAVAARVDRVVAELVAAGPADAVVFAHGHLLRALAVRWMDLDLLAGHRLDLATGAVSVLGWKRGTRVLVRWNDDRHVRR